MNKKSISLCLISIICSVILLVFLIGVGSVFVGIGFGAVKAEAAGEKAAGIVALIVLFPLGVAMLICAGFRLFSLVFAGFFRVKLKHADENANLKPIAITSLIMSILGYSPCLLIGSILALRKKK